METKTADLNSLKIDKSRRTDNPVVKRRKNMLIFGLILILLLVVVIITKPFGNLFTGNIEVKMTYASLQSSSQTNAILSATGYVVAQRKAAVASKGTGRLVYLAVVEGDHVTKDQIIARIEDSDMRAQVEQAKANLKLMEADLLQAKNNYERQKVLFEKKLSSEAELENAEALLKKVQANIEVAKANLNMAEIGLDNTLIKAPFNGTVLTKNADIGEIVAPLGASVTSKGAVVTMADMSSLQVEADVSESNIEKIKSNQNCEITLDAYPEISYPGFVSKIVPTANRSKATVMVKIGFKNYDNKVLPEMSAKVLFLTEKEPEVKEKPALVIPETSIQKRDGSSFVFTVKDGIVEEIPIATGRKFNSYVEVKFGLNNGDRIIEEVSEKIKNGIKVKIKE